MPMTRSLRIATVLLFVVPSCVSSASFSSQDDPRLGDLGRVRFASPGCDSSTTLVAGSTATLTLEPTHGRPLPGQLTVATLGNGVLSATRGDEANQVMLAAHQPGESYVELSTEGMVHDGLAFNAEPATAVEFEAPDAVFVGTVLPVRVSQVYGRCGRDCPLIGHSFMDWRGSDAGSLALLADTNNIARFAAGAPGPALLRGRDPTTGALLVDHAVTVVPLEDFRGLAITSLVAARDGSNAPDLVERATLPIAVAVGDEFMLIIRGVTDTGATVYLSPADVAFVVVGDRDVLELKAAGAEDAVNFSGPVYEARAPGSVTIRVEVELLDHSESCEVIVSEAP